ncbi:MAG: 2-C-methyl-D-erythritol 4-phosphate cytidylyltransferase [Actinobacteria bacterium]|nr:MAG: 2-C-methyl-D-erythritol 4-phosphate cytidylyltransferase [Actinomycetota bacterium]
MAVALVVAAGRGKRLGGDRPKALLTLAGRPMVDWSVRALSESPAIERIVVALPPGAEAPAGATGVAGGPSRSASVRAALGAVGPGDPVLVHDAARPLLTAELVARVLEGLSDGADGAIAAAPVTDTIKQVDAEGRVTGTLERERLWAVQTPQAFRRHALERALDVDPRTLAAATDDAWLVERSGGVVRVVPAPPGNLKVTELDDLVRAEAALAGGAGR